MATSTALISQFDNIRQTNNGKQIAIDIFLDYIKEGKWQDLVLPIRAMDKKQRDEAKKKVPNVTLSGLFQDRTDSQLQAHSGFIGIDIDDVDPEETKSIVCADNYVYAAFTSISGKGLCVLFKINGDKHREAFAGISQHLFENYGIIVDPTAVNPSRARFVSFDPHIFINTSAQKFTSYPKQQSIKKIEKVVFAQNDFEQLIKEIQTRHLDICNDYHDWVRIAFAFADKFGESGRDYFHAVSQVSGKYESQKADKQYTCCLKAQGQKRSTIATFYYYCKNAGLSLYSEQTRVIAHAASQAKKGGRTQEQAANTLLKFESIPIDKSSDIIRQVFENDIQLRGEDTLIDQVEQWLRHNYSLRRNSITRYIENDGKPMQMKDFNSIFISCKKIFDKVTFDLLEKIINSDFTQEYNPLIAFIDTHIARTNRGAIKEMFSSIHSDNADYVNYFGTKWLVGVIASIHGEHSPLMLILSGSIQGTGKTEFLRRLLPSELRPYYAESKLDAGKDDEILMTQKLIIMDDEMGGKSKAETKRLKELTSKQTFSLREPYGRNNVDLQRLAVLCGTTNDKQILSDPTGNRRIIPVQINAIDHDRYNRVDKIDVFMEAYHLWKDKWDWRLSTKDIELLGQHTNDFENYSIEYELIVKTFRLPVNPYPIQLTATDIKVELERNSMQKLSLDRIGKELQRLGFAQKSVRIDGCPKKIYEVERTDSAPKPIF